MAGRRTPEEVRVAREAQVEELQETLTASVEALVTGEDWKRALTFVAQFRKRSANNVLLIFAQHEAAFVAGLVPDPYPTYVAGKKQWESLGREVIDGQKPYSILAPFKARFASATPGNPDSWRRLKPRERPSPGESVRERMIGVTPARVFDISQTEGAEVPLPPRPKLLEGEAPAGLREGLIGQIVAAGYEFRPVPHEREIRGANGLTHWNEKWVAVRTNMDDAAQVKTLAHELAHIRLHDPDDEDATRHRGIAEVEAESVALMIGAAHGMDTAAYTIPYVSGWAATVDGKDPVTVVKHTAERVRQIAVSILDQLDTVQLGTGEPPGLLREPPARAASKQPARTGRTSTTRSRPARASEPTRKPVEARGLS
ncbi:MAG: ImmA/IrrE family metallo-endopeptidase [Leucobacter sp.]